jgi:hypothetical protein
MRRHTPSRFVQRTTTCIGPMACLRLGRVRGVDEAGHSRLPTPSPSLHHQAWPLINGILHRGASATSASAGGLFGLPSSNWRFWGIQESSRGVSRGCPALSGGADAGTVNLRRRRQPMTGLGGTQIRQTEPLRGQHPASEGGRQRRERRSGSQLLNFSVVSFSRL